MGLWNDLLSLLGWGDEEPAKTKRASRTSRAASRSSGPNPGDVFSGHVDYIDQRFVKVASDGLTAVVFLGEMADRFINHPSEVLHVGQAVDFVLLKYDPRGWEASIRAAAEAKIRAALARVGEGDRIRGKIVDLKDRGVILDEGSFEVWIPIAEIAWRWIDHPTEAVSLGDEVEAQIIRIELPVEWLADKRRRRARAVASLRACLPQPVSPQILIAFSSLPFKVWAIAKTPRSCDPVVLYVLEDLVAGRTKDEIAATTGLPSSTLDRVHEVLVGENLGKDWRPSTKGKRLVEAVSLARELNSDPIRGLFASAANPASQFISEEVQHEQPEYPRDWPRPPFNKAAEDTFARATDEALPEPLIERIVTEDKRSILANLQEDDRLRVFLRRDGSRPWKPTYVETPEYWFLAGLWSAFEPFIGKPYRPADGYSRCLDFLMVRCHAVERKNGKPLETVYFEPYTSSVWLLQSSDRVIVRKRKGTAFPTMPPLGEQGMALESGAVAKRLVPDAWCVVEVR